MIQPSKHAHPDKTLIAVSFTLLTQLRSMRFVEFDELRRHLSKQNPDSDSLFLPALNLLFLLGLVAYQKHNDSFEYIGSQT